MGYRRVDNPVSTVTTEPEAVRAQVDKINASKGFVRADRLAGFLRFVVDQSLEGRSGGLKETSIGVEVFGRPADYDPKQDSVVRTEAGKLRTRLAEYYRGEGAGDPIIIELPKGGYAPAIRRAITPAKPSRLKPWQLVAGFAVVLAAGVVLWRSAMAPSASPSIAVLPFVNITGDPENDYLSDGLTEEITDRLANTNLKVIARTSSSALRAKGYTVREIGAKLNVATVLEGSVRKQGERVKITAQLIRVSDETHILSHTFDRNMGGLFELQADVAAAIVQTLRPKLSNGSGGPLDPRSPGNAEAYQLYLKGRYFLVRARADSTKQAIECFEQAIAKDPGYARAYAGLAKAYLNTASYQGVPKIDLYPKAKSIVIKALDLDQESAEAHAAFASLKWQFEGDRGAAEKEFQRAVALNPDSEETLLAYGFFLLQLGRLEEGRGKFKRAESVSPLSLPVSAALANADYSARRYDAVIDRSKKMLEMDQAFWKARHTLGRGYMGKRMYPEAIQTFQALPVDRPGPLPALLAYAYAVSGQRAEAERILHDWENFSRHGHVGPTGMALIYVGLGDKARAIDWLETAFRERDFSRNLKLDAEWDSLRSEPRFIALLKEMKLTD